jgi:hypothetical protein
VRWRRRRAEPMPSRFDKLATYNSEVGRGLVHTPEWREQMAELQREFHVWRFESTRLSGEETFWGPDEDGALWHLNAPGMPPGTAQRVNWQEQL